VRRELPARTLGLALLLALLAPRPALVAQPADSLAAPPPWLVVGPVELVGNRVTRERVVMAELGFAPGDSLPAPAWPLAVELARANLLRTPLFNFVEIDTFRLAADTVSARVRLQERWYTWPYLFLNYADQNLNAWWQHKQLDRLTYGLDLHRLNFRGRNELLKARATWGYSRRLGLSHENVFLDRRRRFSLGMALSYTLQDQAQVAVRADRLVFFEGQGAHLELLLAALRWSWRPDNQTSWGGELDYSRREVSDSLRLAWPEYLGGTAPALGHWGASAYWQRDSRDNGNYPLSGWWVRVQAQADWLGDGRRFIGLSARARRYQPLPGRWSAAASLAASALLGRDPPFFLQGALGFNDYIRGYEYYLINGRSFLLSKNQIRFNWLRYRQFDLDFFPLDRFPQFSRVHVSSFVGAFVDLGQVWQPAAQALAEGNLLVNRWQASAGLGWDWVTYYDKVLRLEWSVNRFGQSGFFLHFVSPI